MPPPAGQSLAWVMPDPERPTDTAYAGLPRMALYDKSAAIGLIDQHSVVRALSPELMLVDPELAERARKLLREPGEANGKGWHMSALGTHEITAGIGLGLEPPLSPPVVQGPSASMPMPTNNGLSELPTPPPAIRPPESATAAPQPAPAPMPQAEAPQQPEPAEQAPAPAQPEPVVAQEPVVAPEPVQIQPAPAVAPEPELPAMAPVEEPVHDYFATPEPAAETLPEMAPIAEVPTPAEPVETVPAEPIELVAAAAPVEEPVAELPAMTPAEPVAEVAPVEFVAPQPVEVEAHIEPEPEPGVEVEVEVALPTLEPITEAVPVATTELEELFAPAQAQSGEFCVVVRLKDGEGIVEVGSFRDFGTAMEGAQEVIEQFSNASEGRWPFYAGRFIRPDLIVSVDVVDANEIQR